MHLNDLPLEIQVHILTFCSSNDLASLSRVQASLRDVAEYVLYSHIQFHARPRSKAWSILFPPRRKDQKLLLKTLAASPRKAAIVKTFYVELKADRDYPVANRVVRLILVKLAKALENMSNLVDLRIMHFQMEDPSEGRISRVIRGGYFKLRTLFLEYSHNDLEGIVAAQPHLQLIGIYFDQMIANGPFWTKIKGLYHAPSRRLTLPTIFVLDCTIASALIIFFPAFYRPGEALQVCREAVTSLSKFPNHFHGRCDYTLSLDLLGISEENISLAIEMVESMGVCLEDDSLPLTCSILKIIIHENFIQEPWRYPEFVKQLALFDFEQICFYFVDLEDEGLRQFSTDLRYHFLLDLGYACPNLQIITLHCHQSHNRLLWTRKSVSVWTLTEIFDFWASSDDEDD